MATKNKRAPTSTEQSRTGQKTATYTQRSSLILPHRVGKTLIGFSSPRVRFLCHPHKSVPPTSRLSIRPNARRHMTKWRISQINKINFSRKNEKITERILVFVQDNNGCFIYVWQPPLQKKEWTAKKQAVETVPVVFALTS